MNRKDAIYFEGFLFVLFGAMVLMAFGYNPAARLLPLLFGVTGLVMILLQLAHDGFPSLRNVLKFVNPEGPGKDRTTDWKKFFQVVLWCCLLIILLYFLSYLIVLPLFIFLMVKFAANESFRVALQTAIMTGAFVWVLFDLLLKAQI